MKHPRAIIATAVLSAAAVVGGVTVAVTAGGPATGASPAASSSTVGTVTPMPTASGSTTPSSVSATTIQTAKAKVGGATETILVNGKGLPLYYYKPDTSTRSMVTGELAALWPPLVAASPTERATGTLHVVHTPNGSQVSYNGHFLYTFAEDSPGQVTGQGVQDFFVATPGISAGHSGTTAATTAPAPMGNGYGY